MAYSKAIQALIRSVLFVGLAVPLGTSAARLGRGSLGLHASGAAYLSESHHQGLHHNWSLTCKEPAVRDVCECTGWVTGRCSKCKSKAHWGSGCDLPCSKSCPTSCDFLGNCPDDVGCPAHCKRSAKVESGTADRDCLNKHGDCQECEAGWYGVRCTEKCPTNCGDSPEGLCTRGGVCYRCNTGWYGEHCNKTCPEGCDKEGCVMKDFHQKKGPDDKGVYLAAGTCVSKCSGDMWGAACKLQCPEHCDKSSMAGNILGFRKKASCDRGTGQCQRCQDSWWGKACDVPCSNECVGSECKQEDGECTNACNPGFWGAQCDKPCPEHTTGTCERGDGMPTDCGPRHFPARHNASKLGLCHVCPANCVEGLCDKKGRCVKGCADGFYGARCDKICGKNCLGACAQEDGQCAECKPRFTGKLCEDACHPQCFTCMQFAGLFSSAGTGENHCLTCKPDEPAEFDKASSSCECIDGAERNDDGLCECVEPDNEKRQAFFQKSPKTCKTLCKAGLQEVLSHSLGKSVCITKKAYNSVIRLGCKDGLERGACDEQHLNIPLGDSRMCLHEDYVENICEE